MHRDTIGFLPFLLFALTLPVTYIPIILITSIYPGGRLDRWLGKHFGIEE